MVGIHYISSDDNEMYTDHYDNVMYTNHSDVLLITQTVNLHTDIKMRQAMYNHYERSLYILTGFYRTCCINFLRMAL
jgi:hypothetical protein